MAKDGFEEASLDDFFQPPADSSAPASGPIAVQESDDAFEAVTRTPAAPGAPQVEDLPITDLGGGASKKKKILIIAGAAVLVLALLAGLYFFLLGGEEAPPLASQVEPDVGEDLNEAAPTGLPKAPPPALKVARLTDLDRSPVQPHVAGSTIYDAASKKLSDAGRLQVGGMAAPLSFYIGTFVVNPHLEDAKTKLRGAGVTPRVKEDHATVTMHRLHVGSYENRSAAEGAKAKLKKAGFDAFVIKESRTSYQLYAGSFFTKQKAQEFQSRLFGSNTGFMGEITDARVDMATWELWGGSFKTPQELEAPLSGMLQKGIEVDVVANR